MTPPENRSAEEIGRSELRRRRDALAEQVTELHWDLGGLAYEMAIRDHFRLDVLIRRAAVLQERDAELAEVERLLRLEESASAGACPHCSAPHSRGALFCWQCGATLMERARTPAELAPAATELASVPSAELSSAANAELTPATAELASGTPEDSGGLLSGASTGSAPAGSAPADSARSAGSARAARSARSAHGVDPSADSTTAVMEALLAPGTGASEAGAFGTDTSD